MANPLKRIDIDKPFFQEAVLFTAEKTGFSQALVEKDYFCSLVLAYLYSSLPRKLSRRNCEPYFVAEKLPSAIYSTLRT